MKELGIKNIITGIFVFAAVIAFMVFSGVVDLGTSNSKVQGKVSVWGTIPFETMQRYVDKSKEQNLEINYSAKNPETYETELINAFASGSGPDLFIMPHEKLIRHRDKIFEIPYTSFPKASYEQTYIDEARLFLTDTGVTAFPMTVDPLLMYYNKPLIASSFILDVPEYWDEFVAFAPALTEYSGTGEVSVAATALGTFTNIRNAKSIIASLIMQNGNSIVGDNPIADTKISRLALDEDEAAKTTQALEFYTSFATFGSETYSWNEALVDSQNKFISGELATYFGRASEVSTIAKKNPNLDFGVALLPQVRNNTIKLTEGAMMGIAISKQSRNIPAALRVASKFSGKDVVDGLAKDLLVAPARKDLLRNKTDDTVRTLVYNSAIIARGWLDPEPEKTADLFQSLVRNINTGALGIADAVSRANADLNTILDNGINLDIIRNKK